MTRVMDGVRRGPVRQAPVVAPEVQRPVAERPGIERPEPLKIRSTRHIHGRLDGVRRPPAYQPPTPVRTAREATAPVTPVAAPVPAPAVLAGPKPVRRWPSLSLPAFEWRRPMIGMAMAAVAFLSSAIVVQGISTPKATTARADQAKIVATASPIPTAAPAPATPDARGLQKLLDDFAAANGGLFSLYVKDLKTGETAAVNADRSMTSASLYKLFVAQRTLQKIDLGALSPTAAAGGGTGRTVSSCLNVMITVSDNGCGRALGTMLGWGKQDQSLGVEGYPGTSLATPQRTSARDVAALFERLYNGTLLSAGSTNEFMNLLKSQRVNNRLPQGIPAGTVFAHKTGDLDGYVHDAGIVYGPKTDYLVVAMSGAWNTPGASPAKFADLSRQLWRYFEQ